MKKKKTIIKFLAKFFITYFVLLGAYSIYLKQTQQRTPAFSCSPITKTVAEHTKVFAETFGYPARTMQHEAELSMKFYIGNIYSLRIVEGCNAVSILILFLSFIIAFSGSLKATVLFGLFGSFVIYIANIIRILLLSKLIYIYPEYLDILHDLFFPAVIYGTVFILWVIWVNKFSYLKKRK